MKLSLKLPPRRTLVPDYFTPRVCKENKLDELINRCNSVQNLTGVSSELLKSKPKLTLSNEDQSQDSIFSRSLKFKLDKEKVKQNIKNYVESQHLEKFKRIKSVIKYDEAQLNDFLTPEDVQNKDAVKFLSLNKRNFGSVEEIKEVKYEKPFRTKRQGQRVNPVETVLSSVQSMMKPEVKKELEFEKGNFCSSDGLVNYVKQHNNSYSNKDPQKIEL